MSIIKTECCKLHNTCKKISAFFLALAFAFCPLANVSAQKFSTSSTSETYYQITTNRDGEKVEYICEGDDIIRDGLKITNVKFHNHSVLNDTTGAIGITGTVENTTDEDIYFKLQNEYFSANNKHIITTGNIHLAPANKTVQFVDMEDESSFRSYDITTHATNAVVPTSFATSVYLVANEMFANQGILASDTYMGSDYVYDSYDINVQVGEDESIKVIESFDAYFATPKHGIIRKLPTRWRTDTINTPRRTSIENISVDSKFVTEKDLGNQELDIRIGDSEKTVSGLQHYEIGYTYRIDKENESSFDEFYYNLIEEQRDVSNITFTIRLPKEFDISRIGFSSGKAGSTNNNVIYYVDDNTIHGFYDGILSYGSITARVALDDGYYDNPGVSAPAPGKAIKIVIPAILICLAVVFIMWYLYGRDEKKVSAVEFYPPDGMNSLDMQFHYKGKVDSDGVVSLLTYFASKGYLKIEEDGRKYVIHKVKDYDGNDSDEKYFFDHLFNFGDEVTPSMLRNRFYRTIDHIIENNNKKSNKKHIFEERPKSVMVVCVLCVIATFLAPIIACSIDFESLELVGAIFGFCVLCLFYTPFFIVGFQIKPIIVRIFFLGFISFHAFVMIGGALGGSVIAMIALDVNPLYLLTILAVVVAVILEVVLITHLPKRNQHGAEMLARIEGFRNFLMTAERSRLEMLVNEDPTYFYNIIPYAYVLGVSKKWMRQFEDINIQAPDWYMSDEPFNYDNFRGFMDHTVSSVSSSMTSSPSSSSGGGRSSGGSSGGGSSGGGGGGGGSSSW